MPVSEPSDRRAFLAQLAGLTAAAVSFPAFAQNETKSANPVKNDSGASPAAGAASGLSGKYPFAVPPLPYAADALEPHIDAATMGIHHDKHHQAYVDKLNAAIEKHKDLQDKSIEELIRGLDSLPEDVKKDVRNQGGGHLNHTMFWESMTPSGAKAPEGALAEAIQSDLSGLDELKTKFNDAGAKQFGSGWAWLVVDKDGKLAVVSTPNQDNPLSAGQTPILGNDVWEHAYYLKYQNKRADYLKAWWNVVDWKNVSERYAAAKKA